MASAENGPSPGSACMCVSTRGLGEEAVDEGIFPLTKISESVRNKTGFVGKGDSRPRWIEGTRCRKSGVVLPLELVLALAGPEPQRMVGGAEVGGVEADDFRAGARKACDDTGAVSGRVTPLSLLLFDSGDGDGRGR